MADAAKKPLSARTASRINDQMTREVLRLVGRDPQDHVKCFEACLKTRDYQNHRSNRLYDLGTTATAVAIAATLNMKNVAVKPDSNHQNIISAFSKSAAGENLFFVKKPGNDSMVPKIGKIARGKFAVTTNDSGDTITPLMLLTMARLSGWCNQVDKSWLPRIDSADEDLSVWKFTGETDAIIASLVSDDIDWEAIPNLMELRTTLLEQPGNQSFQQVFGPPWNECLLNQEADGLKNIIIGALQRLFDTIAHVVERTHPIYGAFLDLTSKLDVTVMSSLDLDLGRAKHRHEKRLILISELSCRNEIVANVAESVGKLDRGSPSQELLLRSKLCSILDSADALILKENLSAETNIGAATNTNDE
ncbi:hypothetical protein FBEOM_4668 [Fusarium beomiforme]|uniref:Uncharacterized protein n=1 Tax=Fusarium beomiforme TaxID=44412 RepID=A0A9P5AMF4_9HYPO|nr:hypothetical protein FBEOM_4668 [Fusarium beomiforme]